ncbi:hypothetical protein LWI28_013295 [Acer negundo]|uniref:Cytochrome P450 76AD1-like protein n=1 Tax=Acer negundo TaxID=4023 RepID=A0AAD5J0C2_ACENE|nr:hypothetical protein LWI28_013295 [Acer negundo]
MDYVLLLLGLSFVLACIHFLTKSLVATKFGPVNLPPGPRPFPVIGNILELGNKPHQALADLSKTFGPIMSLKLGTITTIVISSSNVAKEALQTHDHALSNRTIPAGARGLDHHKHSIVWLPVSAPWRNLRKVCATQMFTAQKLDATQALRRKKVQELLDHVHESCGSGSAVDIGKAVLTTVLNSISNTFFSIDLARYQFDDQSLNFNKLIYSVMEEAGTPNIADYFPVLQFFDPQGIRKRVTTNNEKLLNIFDGIIDERIQAREKMMSKDSNDLLDSLLNIAEENSSQLSLAGIKHLLLGWTNKMAEHEMDLVESTVKCLRSLRAEVLGKSTNERQPAFAILTERVAEMIRSHELEIMTLASSSSIKVYILIRHV